MICRSTLYARRSRRETVRERAASRTCVLPRGVSVQACEGMRRKRPLFTRTWHDDGGTDMRGTRLLSTPLVLIRADPRDDLEDPVMTWAAWPLSGDEPRRSDVGSWPDAAGVVNAGGCCRSLALPVAEASGEPPQGQHLRRRPILGRADARKEWALT